ncbi:ABC transporter substrate-binding protein [Thermobifida halotolerans]|jgi:iron complex transport system substrate-binding protein|uniref:ABC transporter substrate-binding protein n=1 Tax=Thermobifida halotolerans TaxID=483545 RepID=A0A399G692_9ACTN|nr:ABC transporter substrate-binding protein [Thermobifida halotolerans]UOE21713.1 ABC transporter substrate-binding protein [Thermobifida halotolerans]
MPQLRPRALLAAALLPAVLALSACGTSESAETDQESSGGEEITVTHAQGETTLDGVPEKVVVFDMSVLSTLDELGVEPVGVPEMQDGYLPEELAHYAEDDVAKVGSLFEPDYEAVNALEPDLIIVAARSAAVYPELSEIAPTIDMTIDNADFLNSFEERTMALASIFGKEAEVTERIDAIKADIAEVSENASDAGRALILRVEGAEATAYGPGSRYGIIHDPLGVPAVEDDFATDARHGDAVSFEFIAEANPDIMFVQDREAPVGDTSGPNATAVLDNDLVNSTNAAKNDKIVYLELFTWYLAPGALSSVEAQIDTVREAIA